MKRFNPSTLRIWPRLVISFSVLLLFSLLLAGLALYRLNELSNNLTQETARFTEVNEIIGEIRDDAEDAARKLPILLSVSREERDALYAEIDDANQNLDWLLARLANGPTTTEQMRAIDGVQAGLTSYRDLVKATAHLINAGDGKSALRMLGGKTEAALVDLTRSIRDLSAATQVSATERARSVREEIEQDRISVALLCLLTFGIGGTLAWLVTRSIVVPLARTEHGARRIAKGDYAFRIDVGGAAELGQLADAMNVMAQGVAEREASLFKMANLDVLTELPLRNQFIKQSHALLAQLVKRKRVAVVVCMDVDRLKHVNNILGFEAGDALVRGTAQRLRDLFETDACVGRLAGGTFVTTVGMAATGDAEAVAERMLRELNTKLVWEHQPLDLSLSIGMALFPAHAMDMDLLLRRAEHAMFESKRLRLHSTLYSARLEESRLDHLSLLSDLQEAIANDHLKQFLQPKVSPFDLSMQGAEALVRWHHPVRGWLSPAEFIPFAESTGRIRQVTQWMLEKAIQTLADWQRKGIHSSLAVNVSTLDLQDPMLPARVNLLLKKYGVAPSMLQLELTESGLMAGGDDPIRVMHGLNELGVRLAIDDFGTGQSSLAYLQRLPVHELKIDRSFVDGVERDTRRQDLLKSIVDLGHSLGLTVTAEGVENEAEFEVLKAVGCNLVQGYFIAKPMNTESLTTWMNGRPQMALP